MEKQPGVESLNIGLTQGVKNELGVENLSNVSMLAQAIMETSLETGDESHLLVVGGMVKPEKQGRHHKDVDLVFYCSSLATEYYTGGSHENFDKFVGFFKKVNEKLNWEIKIENPWFMDYETAGDGKVVFSNNKGTPIEVLPVRQDSLLGSFQNYLKSEKNPYEIMF